MAVEEEVGFNDSIVLVWAHDVFLFVSFNQALAKSFRSAPDFPGADAAVAEDGHAPFFTIP
ncbi:MAG: hypothetical protein LUQ57_03915 [Methylococcaceae bacterium]|nr:hypothetical protein [Methylococcaceae bacterium]